MKKSISVLIALLLLITLTSCAGDSTTDNNPPSTENEASSIVSYPFYEVTSPVYQDLTLEDFKKLYVDMPFEEAIKIVGAPHEHKNDYAEHIYTTSTGKEIVIHYKNGAIEIIEYPVSYEALPKYTDLTIDDINKLYIGMPFEEAIEILGDPHRTVGGGKVWDVYKLTDGKEWMVLYRFGAITEIHELTPDS